MGPKQYTLRIILTQRPVHQTWETEPKTLRELRDYLEKLNENPNPMTPNGCERIRRKRQHHSYNWGQRVTPQETHRIHQTHVRCGRHGCRLHRTSH